jgi:nicotinate-nucleotide adenylyltransferase
MKTYASIGLMGGTFDPIHYGHLMLAEQVRSSFGLDVIYFVPAGDPPHKEGQPVTPKWLRYQMVMLGIADNPDFQISDCEVKQAEPSYTVRTIEAFKARVGPDCEIYFITGADQIMAIESWKDYQRLLREITFVGASRPGYQDEALLREIHRLRVLHGARIRYLQVPALAISSSDIRRRVRNLESIKYLLPGAVEAFIMEKGLYR